jgi:hypothetical protein
MEAVTRPRAGRGLFFDRGHDDLDHDADHVAVAGHVNDHVDADDHVNVKVNEISGRAQEVWRFRYVCSANPR